MHIETGSSCQIKSSDIFINARQIMCGYGIVLDTYVSAYQVVILRKANTIRIAHIPKGDPWYNDLISENEGWNTLARFGGAEEAKDV